MVAQIQTATIQTSIIYTYTDFDGVMVDVVEMVYPDGHTETRSCWTEENLDGETTHSLVTRSGSVIKSTWKNSQNNKWLTAYVDLWIQRYQAECLNHQANMDTLAHPEFYTQDDYAQAKADLGFGW